MKRLNVLLLLCYFVFVHCTSAENRNSRKKRSFESNVESDVVVDNSISNTQTDLENDDDQEMVTSNQNQISTDEREDSELEDETMDETSTSVDEAETETSLSCFKQ